MSETEETAPIRRENWVELEGATNVRDIGGWPTAANVTEASTSAANTASPNPAGRIRTGALYRGDRLNNLTEDDLFELASRGIHTVVDFRAAEEIQRDPSRLWHGVSNVVSLPIQERNVQPVALLDRILARQITAMSETEMAEVYMGLLDDNAEQFARFATIAADVDNWPMLFHCTAGKDRTGIATAILLELCGVRREQVLDEYCVTNEQRSKRRIAELAATFEAEGIDLEAVKPLLMAPRPVLAETLRRLDETYGGGTQGGVEGFLVTNGGLDPNVPAELRINLVI